jgi:NitT/TauT family transport system permease protein
MTAGQGAVTGWSRTAAAAGGLASLAVAWEVVSRVADLGENTMPGALPLLRAMGRVAVDTEYLGAVGQTLWGALLGLLVAVALGVPLGVLLGSSNATYRATIALVDLLRPVPAVALIPVVVLFFGAGLEMKVFLVAFSVIWTILLNTIYAVRDVDPLLKETARSYGFTRRQVIRHIVMPSAAPFIYTGLRIGTTAALIVAISAELLTGGGGLGQWLSDRQQAVTHNDLVYAGALLSGLVGVALNVGLNRMQKKVFGWHGSARSASA